ncbi:hypothetical protein V8E54_006203, partial [Elaphomyces granulatus]
MITMQKNVAIFLIASLLGALPTKADGMYSKGSPVLQVDSKTYDRLIAKSNHTSLLKRLFRFYAPWCGHCQNLKPAYEKVARNLEGLAKVAAINCDADENKPLCGQMGVQGFPTLKIVVPSKKPGKPRVEDYQGPRSTKAIVDAVVEKIPNHVKRLDDKDLEDWLSENKDSPKAVLFTEKGTTSALLRALAIDFLGGIKFAQIRSKESGAVEKFDIKTFPTLALLPAGETEHILYEGELKKTPMLEFLHQAAEPNPDLAPEQTKPQSSKKSSKSSATPSPSLIIEEINPTEFPDFPDKKPAQIPIETPKLNELTTPEAVDTECLNPKSGTCILALLPEAETPDTEPSASPKEALSSLSEVAHVLTHHRQGKAFPIYSLPAINARAKSLRNQLGLSEGTEVEIVAVNGRRGWWKRYEPADKGDFRLATVETWVDVIRLGEGSKNKLPEGVIVEEKEEEQEKEEKEEKEDKEGKGEEKVEKVEAETVEEKVEEE